MVRRNLLTLGIAGAGAAAVAAGAVAERVVLNRARQRPAAGAPPALIGGRRLAVSDGAELHVVTRGHGRPLVLVHGLALTSEVWRNQLADLAGTARVVAYDQRGHGASAAAGLAGNPQAGLTLEGLGRDLSDLLEALDLSDAVVVGHSLGGMVVLRALADNPGLAAPGGRVGALALVATSATPAAGRGIPAVNALLAATRSMSGNAARLASRLPGNTLPLSDAGFLLARMVFGAAPTADDIELTREITSHIPLGVSAELLIEILGFDGTATLGSIRLPTTVVVGTRDLMTPLRHARALARRIDGAELVELPGCGHMPMLERREDFNLILRRLVAGPARAPGGGAGSSAPAPSPRASQAEGSAPASQAEGSAPASQAEGAR